MDTALKKFRKELGISQSALAEKLGISQSALGYYERGERSIDSEVLMKLADEYSVSVDYILGRKVARNPENKKLVASLGISEEAIENIKQCIQRPLEIDRFLSAPTFVGLMVYITAFWNVDNVELLSNKENYLGISFHESTDTHMREQFLKAEISDIIEMILKD